MKTSTSFWGFINFNNEPLLLSKESEINRLAAIQCLGVSAQILPGLRNPLEPVKLTIIRFEDTITQILPTEFGGGKE